MQTFTVKIAGEGLTAKEIREAIWMMPGSLKESDIIVEEN